MKDPEWWPDDVPPPSEEQWEARIYRAAPFTWSINPVRGAMGLRRDWISFGSYARAERKARRILARFQRRDARWADERTIR